MKTETLSKNETIQILYHQLDNKADFIRMVAKDFNKKPGTLKNHWFSCFFSVPEAHEDKVIELLEESISGQTTKDHE